MPGTANDDGCGDSPRPKLKAERAAKKDSKKRARDDAQIGSDGLKKRRRQRQQQQQQQ